MRMIPAQPVHSNSTAERRVFDQLRATYCSPDQTGWFALHSLNLPRHEYKKFGEIDFVVCGPGGLFVLEVKGGGVACHDGVWETTNRFDSTERLKESPFKQAETALHGLRSKLPATLAKTLVMGYGVVMPDVTNLPPSAEWEPAVLADARDFKQFEHWLSRLIQHWRRKHHHCPKIEADHLRQLQQYLRPDFEAIPALGARASAVEERIVQLTQDQFRLIDAAELNPRVICKGGAGTGKTMLALELARRWSATGMTLALTCHSPWMKSFLQRQPMTGVTICRTEAIALAAQRSGVAKFDAVIVDEGQDILNMTALSAVDRHLRGGLEQGRWCFFHDINNQTGLCGDYTPDAYEYLLTLTPTHILLRTNCRNALPILRHIQTTLQADMGNCGVGDGPDIRQATIQPGIPASQVLARELTTLVEHEGFEPADIVILSAVPFGHSAASSIEPPWRQMIRVLDEASPLHLEPGRIGFAQVAQFKGLESEVVILVDLPALDSQADIRAMHYVGMSRARAVLSLIVGSS